jgi:1,2-diacylglycerol 3-alpha-glucosyltransferase
LKFGFDIDASRHLHRHLPARLQWVAAAVSALARELTAIGHHPSIIAPEGGHSFNDNFGCNHIYLPAFRHKRIPLPLCWSALGSPESKRIVNSQFDIIHAHSLGPVGVYGARVAHRLNIPLVITIHTDVLAYVTHYRITAGLATPLKHILLYQLRKLLESAELQSTQGGQPLEQLIRCFAAASACVIMPTEKTARKLADYIGNSRLEVCPSGVELPRRELYDYQRPSRMLGVIRLLYVGRITAEKGIPMLLGSIDDLVARGYNIELTLAGPTSVHSGLLRRLRPLVGSGNVRLVGILSGKDLWKQYRRADIFVFSSTTDTQGLVLHEAAHAGLPIVMVDPLLTIVSKPGLNAILSEPSVANLADAIELTINKLSDSRWREMVDAAGMRLASQYSLSTQTLKLTSIYGQLINESKDHLV